MVEILTGALEGGSVEDASTTNVELRLVLPDDWNCSCRLVGRFRLPLVVILPETGFANFRIAFN